MCDEEIGISETKKRALKWRPTGKRLRDIQRSDGCETKLGEVLNDVDRQETVYICKVLNISKTPEEL